MNKAAVKATILPLIRPLIRNVRTVYQKATGVKFRYTLLNELIRRHGYKTYLEIGVQDGYCLNSVRAEKKVGVDPAPRVESVPGATIHKLTSDDFFRQNKERFDLIFIDGLHTHEQSLADFKNAEKVLNPGGSIVFHDANPQSAEYALSFAEGGRWSGDVFKTIVHINSTGKYKVTTLDIDCGCAVVQPGTASPFECELNYGWFEKNRQKALNLISWDDWIRRGLN